MRTFAAALLLSAGFGGAARAQDAQKCAGLIGQNGVTSAKIDVASPAGRGTPALPEHCEALGKLNDRTGANGQHYSIQFRLRLPAQWNGKFFFQGGGGSNGSIGNAAGDLQGRQPQNALGLGYAVVSQDSGHENATNNDPQRNGTTTFGFDDQARLDFGYNSYEAVTKAAKALIQAYYGRPPARSYYVGCSEGGREAMMVSQRFANEFDGVLACSPGFRLPKAAFYGETWDTQVFANLAKQQGVYDRNGEPLLSKTFTDEDLDLAAQAVLGACDTLDGLEDGIIDNFPACTGAVVAPKLAAVTCKGPKRNTCLSAGQVDALKKVIGGAKNSKGELLWSDWAWDRGIGGKLGDTYNQGWRSWKLGAYDSASNSAINTSLGALAVSAIFTTPPTPLASAGAAPEAFLLGIDFNRDAERLNAALDFMKADSTDMSVFKNRGGKMVIVQGVSDPIFSIKDTINWWTDLNRANNGSAGDFVRLFAVPGMNHCAGGPATDQFDAFAALVNWVEKGQAPDSIVAKAGTATPFPGRTRPLCAWPKQARYNGSGNIEDAANFSCR